MKIRTIATITTVGALSAAMSLGFTAAHAAVEPVTFSVAASGALSLDQTPSAGTALIQATAVAMPVTTVTDARNDGGTRAWTVTATASALTSGGGRVIPAGQITMDETGEFSVGSGTAVNAAAVVGSGTLVSASDNTINSVYTYTPTATLAAQSNPYSGAYTGTVTQTVA